MKRNLIIGPCIALVIFGGYFILRQTEDNESRALQLVEAYQNYDCSKALEQLHPNWKEVFIDDSEIEIEGIHKLEDIFDWNEIMQAELTVLSSHVNGDTVVVHERHTNLYDSILGRESRLWEMTYVFKDEKIIQSIIDTLPGHRARSRDNYEKLNSFNSYCEDHGWPCSVKRDNQSAVELKQSLLRYAEAIRE